MAKGSKYVNPDGTFKGGFDGCMGHFTQDQGLPEERARRLCAYIGRRAGKIATDGAPACQFIDGAWLEVFRAGDYGEKGKWTEADLDQIAADYDPALHEAPAVLGHPANDAPAYGWIGALKRAGNVLLAYVVPTVQEFVDAVRKGLYKKVSVALFNPLKETGRPYLRHVGFLGAAVPEVKGLAPVTLSADQPFVTFEGFGFWVPEIYQLDVPLATAADAAEREARRRAAIEVFYQRAQRILTEGMITNRNAAILEQLDQLQAVLENTEFTEPETKEDVVEKKTFIEWLRDGLQEMGLLPAKSDPAAGKQGQFTEAQVQEREAAAATRAKTETQAAAAKASRSAAVHAGVTAFVDAGVKAGTFLPAWKEAGIPAVLERTMLEEAEISFGEGKPTRKAGEILMDVFKTMPKIVPLGEHAAGQATDPDAALKAEFAAGSKVHEQLGVTFEMFKKQKAAAKN